MDGTRFDELTRRLASGTSRRTFLRGVAGGFVAALVGQGDRVDAQRAARQANGIACTRATDCATFLCVDGVCCDSACTGQCEACNLTGSEGTCLPVSGEPVGSRPACPGSGPCAAVCDGQATSQCAAFPGTAVACGSSTCVDGVQTGFACSGNGSCAQTTATCGLFVCDPTGTACLTTCQTNDDCVGQAHCANGVCQGDGALGTPCTSADACQSGFCADGVCCIEACDQPCHSCGPTGFCDSVADETSCDGGLCCDGDCIDPSTDPEHCGGCDAGCVGGHICVSSICVCPEETTECGGLCVPPCQGDQSLDAGSCQCVCPPDTAACSDGSCVELGSVEHCLACDDACGPLQACRTDSGCCTRIRQVCDGANDDCCGRSHCVPFNGQDVCCVPVGNSATAECDLHCELDAPCAFCCSNYCDLLGHCAVPPSCPSGSTLCGSACVSTDCPDGQSFNEATCECQVDPPDSCPDDQILCGDSCLDTDTDRENCGDCGVLCGLGENCCDGLCHLPGSATDPTDCGPCGVQCSADQVCRGTCCSLLGDTCEEGGGACCGEFPICCDGSCRDPRTDPLACGTCDNVCEAGQGCEDGLCCRAEGSACAAGSVQGRCCSGLDCCGGICTNTLDNDDHCGECDNACDGDAHCSVGTCCVFQGGSCTTDEECRCNPDNASFQCCDNVCRLLTTDEEHCGACGNACAFGASCIDSVCEEPPCTPFGQFCTSGVDSCCGSNVECRRPTPQVPVELCLCPEAQPDRCDDRCVDLQTSFNDCGTCGHRCPDDSVFGCLLGGCF